MLEREPMYTMFIENIFDIKCTIFYEETSSQNMAEKKNHETDHKCHKFSDIQILSRINPKQDVNDQLLYHSL